MSRVFEGKKKGNKITFENIDTNPEAPNLATLFSIIPPKTGFQGFLLPHMAYISHSFLFSLLPVILCHPSYSVQLWIMLPVLLLCECTQNGENSYPNKWLGDSAAECMGEQRAAETEEKVFMMIP